MDHSPSASADFPVPALDSLFARHLGIHNILIAELNEVNKQIETLQRRIDDAVVRVRMHHLLRDSFD